MNAGNAGKLPSLCEVTGETPDIPLSLDATGGIPEALDSLVFARSTTGETPAPAWDGCGDEVEMITSRGSEVPVEPGLDSTDWLLDEAKVAGSPNSAVWLVELDMTAACGNATADNLWREPQEFG